MSEFPARWATASLGEINSFKSQTIDPSKNPSEEYELYSVPSFPSGKPEIVRGESIGSTKQTVLPNDVLVCKINPRINRVWRVASSQERVQIASSEWIGIRAMGFDARFLQYYFSSPIFRALIEQGVTGVGGSLTRAQPKRVATFPVPVTSLLEQKRIADKLDTCMARARACRERLENIPDLVKRFRETVLEAAVSGRLTEEWRKGTKSAHTGEQIAEAVRARHADTSLRRGLRAPVPSAAKQADSVKLHGAGLIASIPALPHTWGILSASEVVGPSAPIIYGILQPGKDIPGGVPYVQGEDIANGNVVVGGLARTTATIAQQYERSRLSAGDVLLCIIRNIKVAVAPSSLEGGNISRTIARLRPCPEVRPNYLAAVLAAPSSRRWFEQFFRGIDMPGLNLRDVRRLPVPIPSIEEQDEIVRRISRLCALADELAQRFHTAAEAVDRLAAATLLRAFRGELVPAEPTVEMADGPLDGLGAAAAQPRSAEPLPKGLGSAGSGPTRRTPRRRQRARPQAVTRATRKPRVHI